MRFDEAREHYREALRLTIATSGPRSANAAMYLSNLALMELRVGDFKTALDLASQALEMKKEALGDGHASVVRTLAVTAIAHFRMGDLKRAIEIQSEVVKRYRLMGDNEQPSTGVAQAELCDYLRRAKQFGKAKAACSSALKILDPDAPDPRELALALTLNAWVELLDGNKALALAQAERAWKLRQEHPGEANFAGQTRYLLALALHAVGRTEEAREHAEEAKRLILSGDPGVQYDLPDIEAFVASTAP
jgi:tetratricopeptide (TPR) repeat protein